MCNRKYLTMDLSEHGHEQIGLIPSGKGQMFIGACWWKRVRGNQFNFGPDLGQFSQK